ncbi:MAG TPA: ROK family protein [Methylomirabilota bacterium]|nr:ROK family protein [Methylomirabilota bacterium]
MSDLAIGVDVGASTISAGLVTAEGAVLSTVQAGSTPGSAAATILTLVERLLAEAAARALPVRGIGLGLPGLVDVEKGTMRPTDGNWMSELAGVPLARLVGERTGLAVFADNDVNALALSEWTWGLGRGVSSLAIVAVGTGIGGGIVANGGLLRGSLNTAGEIGHMAISVDGPTCVCGAVGCLGVYLSGRLLPERIRERLAAHPDSSALARAGGDPARIDARGVFAAAADGDALARLVVDQACEALAIALGGVANLLDPDVIVVTGGVAASLAPLRDDVLARMRRRTLPAVLDATTLHIRPADKRHTVRGGAALVFYELGRRRSA